MSTERTSKGKTAGRTSVVTGVVAVMMLRIGRVESGRSGRFLDRSVGGGGRVGVEWVVVEGEGGETTLWNQV